jgi:hypothetical protein
MCVYSEDLDTERVFSPQKADGKATRAPEKRRKKAWIEAQLTGLTMLDDDAD